MKIAFLGKGGSGKTTLATAMVRHLRDGGKRVLAIDADHNMDLVFNLGADSLPQYLGTDPSRIKTAVGASVEDDFGHARNLATHLGVTFRLSPPDAYTADMAMQIAPDLFVMAAGPHTDIVRSGARCSHSLASPLKLYLPLLVLAEDEAVVIDERAGTDPVATGILSGVDRAVIVREPTIHSMRVAEQIRCELEYAKVPYVIVDNKIKDFASDTQKAVLDIQHVLVSGA